MPDTAAAAKELIGGLATADVIDALAKTHPHRAHIIDLVSPDASKVLFGPAVTIGFMPVRQDLMDPHRHSLGPAIYRAIGDADPAGKVLVMASGGNPAISLGGSTKLARVTNLNMAGVLCDGRLRDFEELAEFPGAFYCTGETVRAGGNLIQPYVADVPIDVAGVTVVPGDYIFADSTGAAVIPAAEVLQTLTMAHKILEMARQMAATIASEDPSSVLTDGSKEA